MSIISLQFMIITAKRQDQAILQSMGMPKKYCTLIFILIGIIISACASISGLISAFTIGSLLQKYPIITLPEAYYVSQLPIIMDWQLFVIIFFMTILLTMSTSFIPILRNKRTSLIQYLNN